MQILHVIHSLRNGGAERVVVDLVKGLSTRGHTNQICTLTSVNKFRDEVSSVPLIDEEFPSFVPNIPQFYYKLRSIISKYKPDIIHCHLKPDGAICGLLNNIPIIRSIQNSRPIQPYSELTFPGMVLSALERRSFFKKNMSIVACSNASKEYIQPYLSKHGGKDITVIENGIDLSRITANRVRPIDRKNYNIITVGTLYKDKNQKTCLLAFKELLKSLPNCYLWVLGDGPERINLEVFAAELGISSRVHFVGFFLDINSYLPTCDLLWSTSVSEGFSIANLEAMSIGIPPIVSNVDGNREMLLNWPELRVELNNYIEHAAVSVNLLSREKKYSQIGNEVMNYARKKYNVDNMSDKYVAFYQQAIINARSITR